MFGIFRHNRVRPLDEGRIFGIYARLTLERLNRSYCDSDAETFALSARIVEGFNRFMCEYRRRKGGGR